MASILSFKVVCPLQKTQKNLLGMSSSVRVILIFIWEEGGFAVDFLATDTFLGGDRSGMTSISDNISDSLSEGISLSEGKKSSLGLSSTSDSESLKTSRSFVFCRFLERRSDEWVEWLQTLSYCSWLWLSFRFLWVVSPLKGPKKVLSIIRWVRAPLDALVKLAPPVLLRAVFGFSRCDSEVNPMALFWEMETMNFSTLCPLPGCINSEWTRIAFLCPMKSQ